MSTCVRFESRKSTSFKGFPACMHTRRYHGGTKLRLDCSVGIGRAQGFPRVEKAVEYLVQVMVDV